MVHISESDFTQLIPELESEELFTRTFLRLDPDRRQAVLDALLEEAAEKGPEGLNIKQIAERSGASIGSLYQYFGSREKLLQFVVKIAVRSMTELLRLSGVSLQYMPLRKALHEYVMVGVRMSQSQQSLTKFLTLAAYQGDSAITESIVEPIASAMLGVVRAILQHAAERGELRADLDMEATSRAVNVLVITLGDSELMPSLNRYWRVSDPNVPFERTVDAALEMLMHGIGAGEKQ